MPRHPGASQPGRYSIRELSDSQLAPIDSHWIGSLPSVAWRAPMENRSRSSPHRFPRSPRSSPPTRRSWWERSPRHPLIRSRSCCYPASNTGCANGDTRTPTKSTGGSNGENPPNTAKTTTSPTQPQAATLPLETAGWLESGWETEQKRGRPRRRYYCLTGVGAEAARRTFTELPQPAPRTPRPTFVRPLDQPHERLPLGRHWVGCDDGG